MVNELKEFLEDSFKFEKIVVDEEEIPFESIEVCNIQYVKGIFSGFVVYVKTDKIIITGKVLEITPKEVRVQALQRATM